MRARPGLTRGNVRTARPRAAAVVITRETKARTPSARVTLVRRAEGVGNNAAERGGFEPPMRFKPHTAFPVLLLQPLGHLSGGSCDRGKYSRAADEVTRRP